MPAMTRVGDRSTGHGSFPPQTAQTGSSKVVIEGVAAMMVGAAWSGHSNGSSFHPATQSEGSPKVFIEGQPAARVGDALSDNDMSAQGSTKVFAN